MDTRHSSLEGCIDHTNSSLWGRRGCPQCPAEGQRHSFGGCAGAEAGQRRTDRVFIIVDQCYFATPRGTRLARAGASSGPSFFIIQRDSCRPMVLNQQWESTRVTFRSQQGSRLEDQTLQLRTVRDEVPQRPAQHLRAAAQGRSEFLWEMMSLKRLVQTRRIRVHRQVQPRGQG